jgi:hypothetical protein
MESMEIHRGRYTSEIEGDFIVFLIGALVNKPLRFRKWMPVARAMSALQREIAEHPEIGCLHIENFGAMRGVSIQYWRSFDHLERFARSDQWSHLESWRQFNKVIRDGGDVGIWHETYRVVGGQYEAMYGNMPVVGLAAAGRHVKIGAESTAARRAGVRPTDSAPVDGY